jgi:hypothetical protein
MKVLNLPKLIKLFTFFLIKFKLTCISIHKLTTKLKEIVFVPDPGKGECAGPVNGSPILGKEGPDPQGGNKGRQLSTDKGREKT